MSRLSASLATLSHWQHSTPTSRPCQVTSRNSRLSACLSTSRHCQHSNLTSRPSQVTSRFAKCSAVVGSCLIEEAALLHSKSSVSPGICWALPANQIVVMMCYCHQFGRLTFQHSCHVIAAQQQQTPTTQNGFFLPLIISTLQNKVNFSF